MIRVDVHPLEFHPGVLLSCRILADANDIAEVLEDIAPSSYVRVGYTGIWLSDPDEAMLDCLAKELPYLRTEVARWQEVIHG